MNRTDSSPDHPITRSSDLSRRAADHRIFKHKRILYVAYPVLTVSGESAGGAEQVLWTLEREMALRGMDTTVAASAGSHVAGKLFSTGEPCSLLDDFDRRSWEHSERILELISRRAGTDKGFDLVHDMSGSFWSRAGEIRAPMLATLHLPREFYSPSLFENISANVSFNCVSRSQACRFAGLSRLAGVVGNGVALDDFESNLEQKDRSGLLWLGRICREKAPHLALKIAERTGMPVTLAGQVYPFSYHRQYFDREVAPRLQRMSGAKFIECPSQQQKRHLLSSARAVLITSEVDETSSLVAMEAAASGTPVIAFARGALREIVRDGLSGFVVKGVDAAIQVLGRLPEIDPAACSRLACDHFSSSRMAEGYLNLYTRVLESKNPRLPQMNAEMRNKQSGWVGISPAHFGSKRSEDLSDE